MSYDHYEETDEIINLLNQKGELDWGAKLQDAMDSGSTGTEIFINLHYVIENYFKKYPKIGDALLKRKMGTLLRKLKEGLV